MKSTQDDRLPAVATLYAVAMSSETAIPVFDAAEATGLRVRQYASLHSLLSSELPGAPGCIIFSAGENGGDLAAVERIQSRFQTIPIIALQNENSAEAAVTLMKHGVFSVVTAPLEHQKLSNTVIAAVELSASRVGTIDSFREAALRLSQATEKELEVLGLILQGRKNKEMAALLQITVRAVEDRRFRLMKNVGAESVAELISVGVTARYYEQGIHAGASHSVDTPGMSNCVRGVEVWEPSSANDHLELTQSCYRNASSFEQATTGVGFRRGEGVPGRVWERRAPVFLNGFTNGEFVRSDAAGDAGVTAVIGFPVFCCERVAAVVLILLDGSQPNAAFESWRLDPQSDTYRLMSGTYLKSERLRRLSEFLQLPTGKGLPGAAAEQRRPVVSSRFADDPHVIRGPAFVAEKLGSGVALPLTDSGSVSSDVFLLLNGQSTPAFSMIQVWKNDGQSVVLTSEHVCGVPSLARQMSGAPNIADSIALKCRNSGVPIASEDGPECRIAHSSAAPAPSFAIAIPTLINGKVVAVTVLAN